MDNLGDSLVNSFEAIIKSNSIGGFIKVNENLMWVDRYGICLSYKIKRQLNDLHMLFIKLI